MRQKINILRDKSHIEQIERWADYVKNNPDWKKKFKPFLDSQIILARRAYEKLRKSKDGINKIEKLRKSL